MSCDRVSVLIASAEGVSPDALRRALEAAGDIAVVGQVPLAITPSAVRSLRPDLLAVDLPGSARGLETGLMVIDQVMAHSPVPILVIHGTETGVERLRTEAIAAGALECLARPRSWEEGDARRLRSRVCSLQRVPVIRHTRGRLLTASSKGMPLVGIAASTGGPQALARVLGDLAGLRAAVLIVQHIHERFLGGFVQVLSRTSALPVEVATDHMQLREGWVHVAPGGLHLALDGPRSVALDAEPHSLHRPSADVLFHSLAVHGGATAIGVVLTGMGDDGAAGLVALRLRGGVVIAQDEASCAVFGMPRAAQLHGAVERMTGLYEIAGAVRDAVGRVRR